MPRPTMMAALIARAIPGATNSESLPVKMSAENETDIITTKAPENNPGTNACCKSFNQLA